METPSRSAKSPPRRRTLAGTAAQPAPAEPAAAPSAGVEAPAATPAAETAETIAEVPAEVTAAIPVGTPVEDPAAEPAPPRDLSAVRPHLVIVKDGIDEDARQAPGFSISDLGHILTNSEALRSR